ncbi:isoprenyl transferase [Marinilabilia salmonicolor]|jgi:undecaprenyl diphosphate synthase|uniref:Isoprenyl transferase n=1 Tax=Marinilabilia salmonicolor TaxID=989 RepID=A0A2T0XNT6_9BACT|nr:isoprenyl transferase [Marinilabilia salmonicolor]PRZ00600.1 undecaprenyl diphosphate synthase [Marinilabilia salmonicolor]RCW29325.1 undecaprenyl diphosphate synthase [Marinilabilia salmonicolor]
MSSVKEQLDKEKLPSHVAIIMDGNGRWAKKRGNVRVFGHKNGVKAVREVTEAAAELGLKFLTLYAFSTENWNRPKNEVDALMSLLVSTIASETKTLMDNNVKLKSIGCKENLPIGVQDKLAACMDQTKDNDGLTLVLALSYSSRWEIIEGVKKIALDIKDNKLDPSEINSDLFGQYLETANMPDPELLIRTSGELRISNFLLWQIAYSELYFCDVLWPDFRKEHFFEALLDYQGRERRFGKISDQVKK